MSLNDGSRQEVGSAMRLNLFINCSYSISVDFLSIGLIFFDTHNQKSNVPFNGMESLGVVENVNTIK